MLTDQGCCKCTHLRKRLGSESKLQISWHEAAFSPLLTEPSPTFPTRLPRSAPLVLSGNTSHPYSEEGRFSSACSRVSEKILSLCHFHSVSRTHVLFPCVRKFPTVPLPLSLLPGPHASASASVSGLCYNYGLLCSHPHRLSKIPHFRLSCKSVSQSHSASN